MSKVGKKIVDSLEQLVADTKAIPAGVPILEGLADQGYRITRFELAPKKTTEVVNVGPYLGYYGRAEYDPNVGDFHGEVIGIRDVITFVAPTPEQLEVEFKISVDDYLEFCESLGKTPEKPTAKY